jgi:DNA-entry nuclease
MEALSVEDDGDGIRFHVFVYNVQPGITIDYATGDSWLDGETPSETVSPEASPSADVTESPSATTSVSPSPSVTESESTDLETSVPAETDPSSETTTTSGQTTYILNTRSMRFHYSSCSGAATISDSNRSSYTGSREDLIAQGYVPCGQCRP